MHKGKPDAQEGKRKMGFLFRVLGDGSTAPSPNSINGVDGSAVPLCSTAIHDPVGIPKSLWTRWKSLPQTQRATIPNKIKG